MSVDSCPLTKKPLGIFESKKKQQKSDSSQGLMKNVSALGVQNVTSQLLIKPSAKLSPFDTDEWQEISFR